VPTRAAKIDRDEGSLVPWGEPMITAWEVA